jgi:hypothetical protein
MPIGEKITMRPTIADQVIGPDALRCPELHDFSDLPESSTGKNWPLTVFLIVGIFLTVGHFVSHPDNAAPVSDVAQQESI